MTGLLRALVRRIAHIDAIYTADPDEYAHLMDLGDELTETTTGDDRLAASLYLGGWPWAIVDSAERPFKRCSCGHCYTFEEWEALEFGGFHHVFAGDTLWLAGCSQCGTTLAVQLRPVPLDAHLDILDWEQEQ